MMEEHNPPPEFVGLQSGFRSMIRREFVGNHTPSFE
jgi:DNA polymerase I